MSEEKKEDIKPHSQQPERQKGKGKEKEKEKEKKIGRRIDGSAKMVIGEQLANVFRQVVGNPKNQDTIDTMIELIPQLPVTDQLKRALYRSSDRVVMDAFLKHIEIEQQITKKKKKKKEMESIFSKWKLTMEENNQLKKFNELLIGQIGERNMLIKQLQQKNSQLTKDVLQATLVLTQIQLQLSTQGVIVRDAADADADHDNDNDNGNDDNNDDNANNELKSCHLCEIGSDSVICVSDVCRHQLCNNCCKNSVTSDVGNNQIPQCPVCRSSGAVVDISTTCNAWKHLIDNDVWILFQGLTETSV
ncbi:hypothetical protein RFI_00969 [Reticulomyxa filosa]|uniref:RING-type domain-containing protein n=1 Tax=Reticulomyxa filosa TaxID=46433 RepID=X6PDA7_RETFI|nr:hypothetical protein RFI_00969 [Reticulomyxa filosa]|eukprot:ETO36093.1 hypothetical protein RFI_00969 [Reticulomyxa filosa]